jgi:hypothetical protein
MLGNAGEAEEEEKDETAERSGGERSGGGGAASLGHVLSAGCLAGDMFLVRVLPPSAIVWGPAAFPPCEHHINAAHYNP